MSPSEIISVLGVVVGIAAIVVSVIVNRPTTNITQHFHAPVTGNNNGAVTQKEDAPKRV